MNENRRKILEMLSHGQITPDEAERLIAALEQEPPASGSHPKVKVKYLRVVVAADEKNDGSTTVNIRVPMQLLRAGVKLTSLIPPEAHDRVNLVLQGEVDAIVRFGGDQARQLYAGAEQLHGDADVYRGGAIVLFIGGHDNAQVFDLDFGVRAGSGWLLLEGGDEALGFVGGDLAVREHFEDLAAVFVHGVLLENVDR